jgi:hypothetical protein
MHTENLEDIGYFGRPGRKWEGNVDFKETVGSACVDTSVMKVRSLP